MDQELLYSRNHSYQRFVLVEDEADVHWLPLEHIASPSCQNVHGINGHELSVAEMKNCRTHRFLIPKPTYWKGEAADGIFENDSWFMLSGESNGSYKSSEGHFVYPPRYGLDRVKTDATPLRDNNGCNVSTL